LQDFKYAIALTGGIGTGKSTVSSILKLYGYEVLDADLIAHDVLDKNVDNIKKMFGSEYIREGRVDRKKLANLVFNDNDKKQQLEQLLHPQIKRLILQKAKPLEDRKIRYFIDIPLFFETKNYPEFNVVCVYAPKDIQLQRIIKRDKIDKKLSLKKINSQLDIEQKRKKAKYIIDNSKDINHLTKEVDGFLMKIRV